MFKAGTPKPGELSDCSSVPLTWYPRLLHATAEQRNHWQIAGGGAATASTSQI